jgi:4-aminobutyrate aminotransferase-like enzyme
MNAHNVGSFLREGLKSLAGAHPNIGHVRGSGFMIGVEIVYNRESRKPAMSIAEKICYKMKEEYCIIMANGGTFMNVLVMTPPMCFSYTDALRVITTLGKILTQIENEGIDNMEEESTGSSYYSLHGSNSLEPER